MRWLVALVEIVLAGCGDQADPDRPCATPCGGDGSCPSGMTCEVGFCAAAGETCTPAFESLGVGTGFACAIDQHARAWCWGANADRQIADDDRTAIPRATVAGVRRWDAVEAGGGHVCALDDGELWCWGRNDRNQVTSAIVGDVAAPIRVEVDGATVFWSKVATGYDYTCGIALARRGDIAGGGRVYCWGAGVAGKLGAGTPDDAMRPQLVMTDIADFTDVAAGMRHTCAVSPTLGVWCWGDGSSGQLGNGQLVVKQTPQSAGLIGATQVALGLDSTCAVTGGGELHCWGKAAQGALGDPAVIDPTGPNQSMPALATALEGWVEVAAAQRYACGRRDNGDVYCWGTAAGGGLGAGRWNQTRAFAKVLEGATALDVGWNATDGDVGSDEADLDLGCAIVDGGVACWGDNRFGQLGQGRASMTGVPVEIDGGHVWESIRAGSDHVCAGANTGSSSLDLYCWGSIEHGQVAGVEAGRTTPCTAEACDVAIPSPVGSLVADEIALGANHTCVRAGDEVSCWGDSRAGQAGAVSTSPVAPTAIPGDWQRLFAGANATCGIEVSSGAPQVMCWGHALEVHPPEVEPALATATELAFGFDFGCALDGAEALSCFGNNDSGTFGNGADGSCGDGACNAEETGESCEADCGPAPLTATGRTYDAIAIGGSGFACGLRDGGIECWGNNLFGQCGGEFLGVEREPSAIANALDCTQLAAGHAHACALCGAGAIVCWGDSRHGEAGVATTGPMFDAREIAAPANETWAAVTAGDGFSCGLTASGRGFCWGSSLHGALGNGARGANLPVAVELEGGE